MSPAIPSPPGTGDVWGNSLNNFLEVSLNGSDGTLSSAAIAQVEAAAGATAAIDVTRFGVPTDGVTDCTAPLRTVINNAVTGAIANGTNYAEIFIPAGKYVLSSPTTKSSTYQGNAQIPLPIISNTGPKFTLIIRSGYGGGDSLPLWTQTTGQKASGACLYTTLTGQSYDSTWGAPSVLGGPTSERGYGNSTTPDSNYLYSNMHVIIDGISVCCSTVNPTIAAFDFWGVAQLTVRSAGAFCDAATTTGGGSVANTFPTHTSGFGLRPPSQGNNDLVNIYSWSCEGYYTGLYITEHCVVTRACCVYCNRGIVIGDNQSYAHGNIITYASVESCGAFLLWESYTHCIVETIDIEHNRGTFWDGGYDIDDGGSAARGYVGFQASGPGEGEGIEPFVNGCVNLKIVNIGRKPATFNPTSDLGSSNIAFPGSGTSFKNPFWRDISVFLSGGTVTNVQVNTGGVGLKTVGTASPCTFMLPSGATVQVTYTGTPTWVFTLI